MDWANVFQDTAFIAAISTAIFFVIDFIKKLYYKLPGRWIQKTPGELWFALSIFLGLGIALFVYWDNFFGTGATIGGGIASAIYGLISGAGSKLMNSIFGTAGAKLETARTEAKLKTEKIKNGKETIEYPQEPVLEATPVIPEMPKEMMKDVEVVMNGKLISLAEVYKTVKVPEGYIVIVDGNVYKIKGQKNE